MAANVAVIYYSATGTTYAPCTSASKLGTICPVPAAR